MEPLIYLVPMVDGLDEEPKAIATVPAVPDVDAYAGRYILMS